MIISVNDAFLLRLYGFLDSIAQCFKGFKCLFRRVMCFVAMN